MEYFYNLPGYREFVGTEKISLYAQYKPAFKKEKMYCGSYDFASSKLLNGETDTFEKIRLSANIIVFIFCSLTMIGFLIVTGKTCLDGRDFDTSGFKELTLVMAGASAFYALIGLILCIVGSVYAKKVNENSQLLIDLGEADCFVNENLNRVFSNMQEYLLYGFRDSVDFNAGNLILNIITIVFSGIYALLYFFCLNSNTLISK